MTVDQINSENSKLVVAGWLLGLAIFSWFSSEVSPLAWWVYAILIVGGIFASSIIIGGGMAMLAAAINKANFGSPEARPGLFKLAGLFAAIFSFIAARFVLLAASSITHTP